MTRLYEASTPSVALPVAAGVWGQSTGTAFFLSPAKVGTAIAQIVTTWTAGLSAQARVSVSPPLIGSGTLDGTVQAYALSLAPGAANARARFEIYVVSRDGTTLRGVALSIADYSTGTGLFGTLRNKSWANGDTLSPVSWVDGDRIVVVRGLADASGTTPQATVSFGDPVTSLDVGANEADTDPTRSGWIDFSKTLPFYAAIVNNIHNAQGGNLVTSVATLPGTPTANALQLLAVWQGPAVSILPPTSVDGCGLTWVAIGTVTTTGPAMRLTVYRAMGAAPFSDAVTAHLPVAQNRPVLEWKEVIGADISGLDGAGAIAQFATGTGAGAQSSPFGFSLSSPSAKPDNVVFSWFGTASTSPVFTPRSGWGLRSTPGNGLGLAYPAYFRPNFEQAASVTYAGVANLPLGAILEVNITLPAEAVACPRVEFISPPPGQPLRRSTPVIYRAFSPAFRRVATRVVYPLRPDLGWQLMHDGTNFAPGYQGPQNRRVYLLDPAYEFQGLPDGGWESAPQFTVYAIDAIGLEAKDLDDGCFPGTGTLSTPIVTPVSPASFSKIYKYTPAVYDVTVPGGTLKRILVRVSYKNLPFWDFAYVGGLLLDAGEGFSPIYSNGVNATVPTTDGLRMSFLRDGGWPAQPKFTTYLVSDRGVEA